MMHRTIGLWLAAAAVALACTGDAMIAWRSPTDASVVTWMPQDLVLDFVADGHNAGSLVVTLNGHDVTALFVEEPAVHGRITAHAEGVFAGMVLPGTNLLTARIGYASASYQTQATFEAVGDPYADGVLAFAPGASGGFGAAALPGVVLGPPQGAGVFSGGLDVVSLGASGRIDVSFTNNVIANGEGADFTVFENPFLGLGGFSLTGPPFAEPGRVSVSQDGVVWYAFPCAITTAPYYPGCAGVYPVLSNGSNPSSPHASIPSTTPIESLVGLSVFGFPLPAGSGGDSFDLADVGLSFARYVRVEASAAPTGPEGTDNARFDLDAVAAVHSVPATDADGNGVPDAVE